MLKLPGGELAVAGHSGKRRRGRDGAARNRLPITAPDGARLTGKIERVSFVGDRQRLAVSGAAPRPLMIDAPNTLLINVGDRIGLSIAPQDVPHSPGEAP